MFLCCSSLIFSGRNCLRLVLHRPGKWYLIRIIINFCFHRIQMGFYLSYGLFGFRIIFNCSSYLYQNSFRIFLQKIWKAYWFKCYCKNGNLLRKIMLRVLGLLYEIHYRECICLSGNKLFFILWRSLECILPDGKKPWNLQCNDNDRVRNEFHRKRNDLWINRLDCIFNWTKVVPKCNSAGSTRYFMLHYCFCYCLFDVESFWLCCNCHFAMLPY